MPAIFIDRDGVINENRVDHVKSWAEFSFLPGSLEAMCRLAGLGLPVVVISNQSAIGRGLVRAETVAEINARMVAEVRQAGGRVGYRGNTGVDHTDPELPRRKIHLRQESSQRQSNDQADERGDAGNL